MMDERYEVFATHGKGVFSTVLRAKDRGARADAAGAFPEVAVKVIRANDIMFKAGARRAKPSRAWLVGRLACSGARMRTWRSCTS